MYFDFNIQRKIVWQPDTICHVLARLENFKEKLQKEKKNQEQVEGFWMEVTD